MTKGAPASAGAASLWRSDPGDELARATGARVHLEVGLQEWVLLPLQRALVDRLAGTSVEVHAHEFQGGHDYVCWRGSLIDRLADLLPQDL